MRKKRSMGDLTDGLDYYRLDVGGYLYTCHRTTLSKHADSMLAKLVSPKFDKRKSNQDYILIDRNGKPFETILNYLRNETSLDLTLFNRKDLHELQEEADYYQLTELFELCRDELEKKTTTVPINFPLYIEREVLLAILKSKRETAIIVNIQKLRSILRLIKFDELLEYFSPLPVYAHYDSHEVYLSVFQEDDIKKSLVDVEKVTLDVLLYKFLASLRKDII